MTTQIQRRRGTTTEHGSFTGAVGEITIDTTKDTVVVHDGSTAGGHPLATENNPTFTGNVGISSGRLLLGLSTSTLPAQLKFEIAGVAGTNYLGITNTTASDAADARFSRLLFRGTQSGGEVSSLAAINAAHDGAADDEKGNLSFRTNDGNDSASPTERMRIDSSGRLLVGTTNAVSFGSRQVLAVTNGTTGGVISLYNSTTATANPRISSNPTGSEINNIGIHAASTNGSIIAYTNNDTERLRIDSSGRVGIGTSSPTTKLEVVGDLKVVNTGIAYLQPNTVTAFQAYESSGPVKISLNNNGSATFGGDVVVGNNPAGGSTNNGLMFRATGGVIARRASGTDNVFAGFINGNASETSKITAAGSASFTGDMDCTGSRIQVGGNPISGTAAGAGVYNNGPVTVSRASSSNIWLGYTVGSSTPTSTIDSSGSATFAGNVGIGRTSASSKLDIQAASGRTQITLRNVGNTSDASTFVAAEEMTSGNADLILAARHSVRFFSNLNEKMRIDSSGRVLVGSTSAYVTDANFQVTDNTNAKLVISNPGNASYSLAVGTDNALAFKDESNGAERMRMDISGSVFIGCTANPSAASASGLAFLAESSGRRTMIQSTNTTSNVPLVIFSNGNGQVGSISTSGSSTAYNTSSDYRLKENVVVMTGAIDRVKQLQPKRFNFIADDTTIVDGFIAHEAQTVVPEAVTGEKDGEEMQGIDQSKLVPLLTAALQEAIAKIETLEAKVAALESA